MTCCFVSESLHLEAGSCMQASGHALGKCRRFWQYFYQKPWIMVIGHSTNHFWNNFCWLKSYCAKNTHGCLCDWLLLPCLCQSIPINRKLFFPCGQLANVQSCHVQKIGSFLRSKTTGSVGILFLFNSYGIQYHALKPVKVLAICQIDQYLFSEQLVI